MELKISFDQNLRKVLRKEYFVVKFSCVNKLKDGKLLSQKSFLMSFNDIDLKTFDCI